MMRRARTIAHHEHLLLLAFVIALAAVAQAAAKCSGYGCCSASEPCPNDSNCCSRYGYCGKGNGYCGTGCQAGPCTSTGKPPSDPSPPSPPGTFFDKSDFNGWFPDRNPLYSYEAFKAARKAYSKFGTSGSTDDQKREIAAFFGNVVQESGGLQFINEMNPSSDYCQASSQYPCAPGKRYYGRGPLQISWNYNYGSCGDALNLDLLANPDLVAQSGTIAFKTALCFWMTSGCHDAILRSSFADTVRTINGMECGHGDDQRVQNRVQAYKRFCEKLHVDPRQRYKLYMSHKIALQHTI